MLFLGHSVGVLKFSKTAGKEQSINTSKPTLISSYYSVLS